MGFLIEAEKYTKSQIQEYTREFLRHCEKLKGKNTHGNFTETYSWKYVLNCLESLENNDSKEVDSSEIDKYKSFVYVLDKNQIFEQVVNLVERLRSGKSNEMPLFGLPISIKDNLTIDGLILTNGTKFKNYKPSFTANSVDKLLRSGTIVVGKTKLNGYGVGANTTTVDNPFGEEFIVGGSSGGSSSSVGGNCVTCSMGTDTGGSVRLPSAFCGCVGYRPSYGAISRYGMSELSANMDTIGFITNTVYQSAFMAYLTFGFDPRDMFSRPESDDLREKIIAVIKKYESNVLFNQKPYQPLKGINIAMFDHEEVYKLGYTDFENKVNMENVERITKLMGANVIKLDILPLETYASVYYLYSAKQVSVNLRRFNKYKYTLTNELTIEDYLKKLDHRIIERFLLGEFVSLNNFDIEKSFENEKKNLVNWVKDNKLFTEIEFLITPTASKLDLFMTISPILGICSINLPLRNSSRPNCFHISSGYLQDHRLFEISFLYENYLNNT